MGAASLVVISTADSASVSIPAVTDLPTPLEEAPPELSGGGPLYLKREDVHELGAFKWRGALPSLEKYWGGRRGCCGHRLDGQPRRGHGRGRRSARGCGLSCSSPRARARRRWRSSRNSARSCTRWEDLDESKERPACTPPRTDLPFFEDGAEPAQFDGYEAIGEEILEQLGERPAASPRPVGNGALSSVSRAASARGASASSQRALR